MGDPSRPFIRFLIIPLLSQNGACVKKKIGGLDYPQIQMEGGIFLCAGRVFEPARLGGPPRKNSPSVADVGLLPKKENKSWLDVQKPGVSMSITREGTAATGSITPKCSVQNATRQRQRTETLARHRLLSPRTQRRKPWRGQATDVSATNRAVVTEYSQAKFFN